MNSGAIPDSAINASSSYDFKSVGPQNSRSGSIYKFCIAAANVSSFLAIRTPPNAHTTAVPPDKKKLSGMPSYSLPDLIARAEHVFTIGATRDRYCIGACADSGAPAYNFLSPAADVTHSFDSHTCTHTHTHIVYVVVIKTIRLRSTA